MSLKSTQRLLDKYEKGHVPGDSKVTYVQGERRTNKQERIHKQEQRLKEKHELADMLMNETKFLIFTNYDKEHVHYLIDKFNDFNKLHRTVGNEVIILAFIFYVAKINNPRLKLNNYRITGEYGLTDNVFELIMCRIVQRLLSDVPIVPVDTRKYDHDVLYRTGQR